MSKKIVKASFLTIIGYILSPLSWWNDIFINIPIAYVFGFLIGLISKKLFFPFMIIGYWLTNFLGLILMHKGISDIAFKKEKLKYKKKELLKDIIISILYTLIILMLVYLGILKFPTEYFK